MRTRGSCKLMKKNEEKSVLVSGWEWHEPKETYSTVRKRHKIKPKLSNWDYWKKERRKGEARGETGDEGKRERKKLSDHVWMKFKKKVFLDNTVNNLTTTT